MTLRVAIQTLGCKVNQYESSYFIEILEDRGFQEVPFHSCADVYLVHGCSVTSRASYQTRQLLRRALRLNPSASVVVAGCNATFEGDRLASEKLATHILGNDHKYDLVHWLQKPASLDHPFVALGDPRRIRTFRTIPVRRSHQGHARTFVKIQDGCDAFCSYCIVPRTRGKSRSLSLENALAQVATCVEEGFQEVVLTGIHLGQWGHDFPDPSRFSELLRRLDTAVRPPRVRLSSLEVMELGEDVLPAIKSKSWICPHFHVPLQSGHGETLRRMNRNYTPEQYSEVVWRIRSLFPTASVGADVMVGFPGETAADFQKTWELVRRLPLTYLHVFPFSPRMGTPASLQPHRIVGDELKNRAKALRTLGARKRYAFMEQALGTWVEVLTENDLGNGWYTGTSENYLRVSFHSPGSIPPGTLVRVRLGELGSCGLVGIPE